MNKKLPEYLLDKYQLIGTVTFTFLFALVFLNLYIPFSDTAWFRLGDSVLFLFTAGFIAVSLLFVIASRVIMYKTKKLFTMTYLIYALWCIGEIVCICLFYTFLTADLPGYPVDSLWKIFQKALLYGTIALAVPYIISAMYFAIIDKNKTIKLMSCNNVVSDVEPVSKDDSQITLFDNSGALKLSVKASNLYYIESDDNYIKVWYTDAKMELKMYMLRCRLKTVEESFKDGFLVRCHRKYIVNMRKVKVLRKESDGYYLDLDNESIPPISVTKTYERTVLNCFSGDRNV